MFTRTALGLTTTGLARDSLTAHGLLFENVIVNRIHGPKGFAGNLRACHAHTECFFHAHDQFKCIDGIETETVGAKKGKVVPDLVWSYLQHQVFYQHLLDARAQVGFGHKSDAEGVLFCHGRQSAIAAADRRSAGDAN